MNHAVLDLAAKPRVAILATGDELVMPGDKPGPDQIVASNPFAIAAFVEQTGGEPIDLGIATDDFAALERAIERAEHEQADVLVTLGGASVGEHDLVQSALTRRGMQLGFWRIAMRPGKPLIHGSIGRDVDPRPARESGVVDCLRDFVPQAADPPFAGRPASRCAAGRAGNSRRRSADE